MFIALSLIHFLLQCYCFILLIHLILILLRLIHLILLNLILQCCCFILLLILIHLNRLSFLHQLHSKQIYLHQQLLVANQGKVTMQMNLLQGLLQFVDLLILVLSFKILLHLHLLHHHYQSLCQLIKLGLHQHQLNCFRLLLLQTNHSIPKMNFHLTCDFFVF